MTEIDLTKGDPLELEKLMGSKSGGSTRSSTTSKTSASASAKTKPAQTKNDAEDAPLKVKLTEQLNDLAEAVENSDPILSDILTRRAEQMAQGLVSLTRVVPFLRMPLVFALNFLQPLLAFFELIRHLAGRWSYSRAIKRARREAEARGVVTVPNDEAGAWRGNGGTA